jgi:hypothetical protein
VTGLQIKGTEEFRTELRFVTSSDKLCTVTLNTSAILQNVNATLNFTLMHHVWRKINLPTFQSEHLKERENLVYLSTDAIIVPIIEIDLKDI